MDKDLRILVVSDNAFLIRAFHQLTSAYKNLKVEYCCTPVNKALANDNTLPVKISPLNIKVDWEAVANTFDIVFSLHCKQIFPAELVKRVKCVNIHPGYNPHNRGWFPQVFSILNKHKAGATIHEIDEQLDHGPIIARKEVKIDSWDTSGDVYLKIQKAEVELLQEHLEKILGNSYTAFLPEEEGNVNLKKDFNNLCQIDMDEELTMGKAIDLLRAVTYPGYKNAYFIDRETGLKVYVTIKLEKEGEA